MGGIRGVALLFAFGCSLAGNLFASDLRLSDERTLQMPAPGSYNLRILSPTLLELTLITTKLPDPAPVTSWNFVSNGTFVPPANSQFVITADLQPISVQSVGFKRRPIYAPLTHRDLRIGNYLYLQLAQPIVDNQSVRVDNPDGQLWNSDLHFIATADPFRWNPAIHVNQEGYLLGFSKKAMIGEYLGSMGEMIINPALGFNIVETTSSNVVYQGTLTLRRDVGYTYSPLPYQKVLEADFTAFDVPGEYRLQIPGLGTSFPFRIGTETAALFARTYALGLYHQRCGSANAFPYTRHTHSPCHTAAVEVPTMDFDAVNSELNYFTLNYASNPRHTAPPLQNVNASLYPFVNTFDLDLSGGHHDAGDYSKYTINSAQLIHSLVFAVDSFPGVAELDNLGIPESGDGISDVLEEAKWEADFLAKMQDADGGFYFLIYPRDRQYEGDVLPDAGDPQVVFPKNTAATAAAVAALAEMASSPTFRTYFPFEAEMYLQKALAGWAFLQTAIATYGRDGAYQSITHYGDTFMHDDELAWAATELFLATGDPSFETELISHFDPSDPSTRVWTWWRLFEGYGCAIRSYAFAAQSGRLDPSLLNTNFLAKCKGEILAAAADQVEWATNNAYGSSFPIPSKPPRAAGWYFSVNQTFDLVTAYQLDPRPEYLAALLSNMNFEGGCNPLNIAFLTGIGRMRQREIVHQYAQNDRRVLPPTGIPLGNIQEGFPLIANYGNELNNLCFPNDFAVTNPYAPYDKWGDTFNTMTEFVGPQQGRSLASMAFLMAQTPEKFQGWAAADGAIVNVPSDTTAGEPITAQFISYSLDLTGARFVWEVRDQEPMLTETPDLSFSAINPGPQWIEVEITMPDGRRIFSTTDFMASFNPNRSANPYQSSPLTVSADTAALYHLDSACNDATTQQLDLTLSGQSFLDDHNLGWMTSRQGGALRVTGLGDTASAMINNTNLAASNTTSIVIEAMIYIHAHPASRNDPLVSLRGNWNASLQLLDNPHFGFTFDGGTDLDFSGGTLGNALTLEQWHHVHIEINQTGYNAAIDGVTLAQIPSTELNNWPRLGQSVLTLGNFDGWIDEVVIKSTRGPTSLRLHPTININNQLHIYVQGNFNAPFVLQTSTNLLNWTPVLTNSLVNGSFQYIDTNSSTGTRFFRSISVQ